MLSDCVACFTSLGKIRAVQWDLPGCELGLALLVLLACVFLSNALGRSSTQRMCSSLPWLFSHSPDVAAPCGERGAKKWVPDAVRSKQHGCRTRPVGTERHVALYMQKLCRQHGNGTLFVAGSMGAERGPWVPNSMLHCTVCKNFANSRQRKVVRSRQHGYRALASIC